MLTGEATSTPDIPADLTNDSDTLDRAADIVLMLADARGLRAYPKLRGQLLLHLCTDEGRQLAARALVAAYGYVSKHPRPFVALKIADASWPAGI